MVGIMRFVWMSKRRSLHIVASTQDCVMPIPGPPLYPYFFPSLGLSYLTPGALYFSLAPVIPVPK